MDKLALLVRPAFLIVHVEMLVLVSHRQNMKKIESLKMMKMINKELCLTNILL